MIMMRGTESDLETDWEDTYSYKSAIGRSGRGTGKSTRRTSSYRCMLNRNHRRLNVLDSKGSPRQEHGKMRHN